MHQRPWANFSPGELDPGRLAASRTGYASDRNPTLKGRSFQHALCNPRRPDSDPRRKQHGLRLGAGVSEALTSSSRTKSTLSRAIAVAAISRNSYAVSPFGAMPSNVANPLLKPALVSMLRNNLLIA